jgi:hypothetical protein
MVAAYVAVWFGAGRARALGEAMVIQNAVVVCPRRGIRPNQNPNFRLRNTELTAPTASLVGLEAAGFQFGHPARHAFVSGSSPATLRGIDGSVKP